MVEAAPGATALLTPRSLLPATGTVDLWRITLDGPAARLRMLAANLDQDERRQWKRMRVGAVRWAAARGARREVLAHYLGVPAEVLRFEHGERGKPRLVGESSLRFNMAAREGLALLAVAADREVGVDLEHEGSEGDVTEVARQFLSPLDQLSIAAAAPKARGHAFIAAWTRHEARRKLHGLALEDPLPPLAPGTVVVVRAVPVPEGFAAAIAASGGAWRVRGRDAVEVLPGE